MLNLGCSNVMRNDGNGIQMSSCKNIIYRATFPYHAVAHINRYRKYTHLDICEAKKPINSMQNEDTGILKRTSECVQFDKVELIAQTK